MQAANRLFQQPAKPLPENLAFVFHDNSGVLKHFPLPDPVPGIEELSEEELLAIAGGLEELDKVKIEAHADGGSGRVGGGVKIGG
ncbi:MAG: hypothetical protein ACRD63_17120 [Pyrinomonadaceae bacterium]